MPSRTWSARDSAATGCETRPTPPHQNPMRTNRLAMAILGLLALLVFHARVRLSVLDPRNVGWMQVGDWPHYLQGWSFYRWDSWRFPIGYFSNLLHPVGTSTGLTDSIPWLALIFKIFDPWLPRSFQYFGLYLLLCFFLQGFVGFRIMMLLSRDRLHSMLSAAFLMVAPALLDRIIHIALCSHWMVLSLILWNVSSARSPESSGVCCRKATALNLLAAVTHPYLWAMTFVMSLTLFARPWRERGASAEVASSFVFWTLLQIVLAVLGWWVFGYLVLGSVEEGGFGSYAGNLAGFFDSAGKTALAPQIGAVGSPPRGVRLRRAGNRFDRRDSARSLGEAHGVRRRRERSQMVGPLASEQPVFSAARDDHGSLAVLSRSLQPPVPVARTGSRRIPRQRAFLLAALLLRRPLSSLEISPRVSLAGGHRVSSFAARSPSVRPETVLVPERSREPTHPPGGCRSLLANGGACVPASGVVAPGKRETVRPQPSVRAGTGARLHFLCRRPAHEHQRRGRVACPAGGDSSGLQGDPTGPVGGSPGARDPIRPPTGDSPEKDPGFTQKLLLSRDRPLRGLRRRPLRSSAQSTSATVLGRR